MNKKIIPMMLCLLLIAMTMPAVGEMAVQSAVNEKPLKIFFTCYIETTVFGEFDPTDPHREFGVGLFYPYGENAETTIYAEQGGDILWHHQGKHRLWITIFIGYEAFTEDAATMYGKAFLVSPVVQ